MPYANNFSELQSMVMSRVAKSLKKNVAPVVEKKLAQSAASHATGAFSRSSDGISDINNMDSDVTYEADGSISLLTKDIAIPQESVWNDPLNPYSDSYDPYGTKFSEWIEYGEAMDLTGYLDSGGIDKPKRSARPFVKPVQDEINSKPSDIISALKKGLPTK